jgi:hypothetical protein
MIVMVVIVIVTVLMVIVLGVAVTVAMTSRIAARFGLEGSLDDVCVQAQLVYQPVEHVVVLIRETPRLDLQRHVAIAQMIGRASQQVTISGFDGRE